MSGTGRDWNRMSGTGIECNGLEENVMDWKRMSGTGIECQGLE